MKVFRFFLTKVFLRKFLLTLGIVALLFLTDYISFMAARSILSSLDGQREMAPLSQPGTFIQNDDPSDNTQLTESGRKELKRTYRYLNTHYLYAFYTDGVVVSVPTKNHIEVTASYMNETYVKIHPFPLSQGKGLSFDYHLGQNPRIPVVVGYGIGKEYPIGSQIRVTDPGLDRPVTYVVRGILAKNVSHSNMYALNLKTYANFSILVPVTNAYCDQTSTSSTVLENALMNIIYLKTNQADVTKATNYIRHHLGFRFNIYSGQDNATDFGTELQSLVIPVCLIGLAIIVVTTFLAVWNCLAGIRLMIREFTLNLLVGLSYRRLRRVFSAYYALIFLLNEVILFAIMAIARCGSWRKGEGSLVTYGFCGLIGLDWLSLLIVLVINAVIGTVIVETSLWRIKKIPISVGVL